MQHFDIRLTRRLPPRSDFAVLASAAAAAAADSSLSLRAATQLAESTPPPAMEERHQPLRSLVPRRSHSSGQLSAGGSPLLALPAPAGWQTPPPPPGWVRF